MLSTFTTLSLAAKVLEGHRVATLAVVLFAGLHGCVLRPPFLSHFALLVKGILLLLQDKVSTEDIAVSTDCLVRFVVGVQFLYGKKQMTFNVHQLLHLPKSVLHQGPLWAHSCFAFESNIGLIKELVTSAKGVPFQIVERLMMASSFSSIKALASPQTQRFLRKGNFPNQAAVVLLGKPRQVASQELLNLVESQVGYIPSGPVVEHDRVSVSQYVFHSEQYRRPSKTDCTAAMLPSGTCVKINHLLSLKDTAGQVRVFAVTPKFSTILAHKTAHIMKAQQTDCKQLVEVAPGLVPSVHMKVSMVTYFIPLSSRALFC